MDIVNTFYPSQSNSISGSEVYSTEETRIGTWIDGKPLYRKIMTGTVPSTTGEHNVGVVSQDIEVVVNIQTMALLTNGYWTTFPYTSTSNVYAGVQVRASDNTLTINIGDTVLGNAPFHSVVEYTKTTD